MVLVGRGKLHICLTVFVYPHNVFGEYAFSMALLATIQLALAKAVGEVGGRPGALVGTQLYEKGPELALVDDPRTQP